MTSSSRARVRSGIPAGGQFAPETHDEAALDLASERPVATESVSTLQTTAPLERLHLNNSARSAEAFLNPDFSVEADYQRGDVWGVTRRRNLIRSIVAGYPIPAIIYNQRFRIEDTGEGPGYFIIDGRQRITTIRRFADDQFSVPASWFPPDQVERTESTADGPYVRFSGLSPAGRRLFRGRPLSVVEASLDSVERERELFELINFGGVPQGETDPDPDSQHHDRTEDQDR